MINRRGLICGLPALALAAAPAQSPAQAAAQAYRLTPDAVGPGLWLVRGADSAIAMDNGGAIANIGIIATDAGAVLVDAGPSHRFGEALGTLARRLVKGPVARVFVVRLFETVGGVD